MFEFFFFSDQVVFQKKNLSAIKIPMRLTLKCIAAVKQILYIYKGEFYISKPDSNHDSGPNK